MNIQGNYSVSSMSYLINQVGYFDDFIAYCDTQNQYNILVGKYKNGNFDGERITVRRNTGTSTSYTISRSEIDEAITIQNDYNIYSNCGIGQYYARDYSQPLLITLIIFLGFYICKSVFGGLITWKRKR